LTISINGHIGQLSVKSDPSEFKLQKHWKEFLARSSIGKMELVAKTANMVEEEF
jgi:hypothetical protein